MGQRVAEAEERPDRLWIPDTAPALDDSDWVQANWPGLSRVNTALLRCPGGCVLKKDNLAQLYSRYYQTLQIEVNGKSIADKYDSNRGANANNPWNKYAD